jgi:hypothetical protein
MTVTDVGADGYRGAPAAHSLARSQQVARWLVEGFSTAEVRQRARDQWGVSHRTADRLVAAGRRELMRGWDCDRQQMIALLLSRLDAVFLGAMEARNFNAAVAVLNAQARLAKL